MRTQLGMLAVAAMLITAASAGAQVEPPEEFGLEQNTPDPFCQFTVIQFQLPRAGFILLEIRDPADTETIRTLVAADGLAGVYSVEWDGLDQDGGDTIDQILPYRLTVTDGEDGELLFTDTKFADHQCAHPVETATWSRIKAFFVE